MTNIFSIKNLYFGGINVFPEGNMAADDTEESGCHSGEIEAVNIDPDVMAKTIAAIEHIDLETVKKVFAGADQFLKSVREVSHAK